MRLGIGQLYDVVQCRNGFGVIDLFEVKHIVPHGLKQPFGIGAGHFGAGATRKVQNVAGGFGKLGAELTFAAGCMGKPKLLGAKFGNQDGVGGNHALIARLADGVGAVFRRILARFSGRPFGDYQTGNASADASDRALDQNFNNFHALSPVFGVVGATTIPFLATAAKILAGIGRGQVSFASITGRNACATLAVAA